MKRILALFICIMLVCTTIAMPTVSADVSYEDYVPGAKPANMLKTASELGGASQWWVNVGTIMDSAGKVTRASTNGYKGTSITAKGTPGGTMTGTDGTWYYLNAGVYVGGKLINSNNPSGIEGDIDDGKNYVYAMQVRNLDATYTPNVRFLLYDIDGPAGLNAKEWGTAGMPVTSTDWMDFKGTIQAPERNKGDTVNDVDRLSIGFNSSTVAGSSIEMNFTDDSTGMYPMYFAEEAVYDITNTLISGDAKIKRGDTLTFEAQIINQVELPGYLDQTFVWKAMDTSRQNEVDGFTIVPSQDTTTAEVTVEDTVLPGSYDIVAYSEEYDMAKGYTITMDAPDYYKDLGDITTVAKLNTDSDDSWTSSRLTTGLVSFIEVKAELEGNTDAFQWFVTDKDRINVIEDIFTVEILTNTGAQQKANIVPRTDVDVKAGDYNIIVKAEDGSVKALPITLNIDKDMEVILNTFISGNADNIEEGFNGAYLSVLGLLDSNASKADKKALAAVIAGASEDEGITTSTELSVLQEVIERLAIVSYYNTKPADVEVADEDGNFLFAGELGIEDSGEVTLYTVFNNKATAEGKKILQAELSGKGYTTWSAFADDAKEAMMLYTLAYPNEEGHGYVADLLTEANLNEIGIDTAKYMALTDKDAFNSKLAKELFTFDELKEKIEKAENTGTTSGTTTSRPSGGGGGGFAVQKEPEKEEAKEDTTVATPETYSFTDVPESHWAYADVHYLKSIGVIDGVDENTYAPNANVTREQFLKLIIEAFGIEMEDSSVSFADVKAGAWYAPYVAAGVENGIINGVDETTFGTGRPISRQDACTIIARALNLEDATEGDLSFTDADSISTYARAAVSALSGYAIINGMGDGSFAPNAVCTRAQAAKIVSATIGIVNALSADGR